jgi:cobalt/nickel transport system ATP-binding protein
MDDGSVGSGGGVADNDGRAGVVTGQALSVRDLRFSYPDGKEVLTGVDLDMEPGERVALLGPNGAGKTTFLLHLIGILEPSGGRISVAGLTLAPDNVQEIRRRVGLVFQDPDDQLFMPTVYEDVAFGPANFGVSGPELEQRVGDALKSVGMEGAGPRAPHHLSGGERRRVALATVLACEPEILVLDEPSSNLDPAGRRELAEVLSSLDTTILMVTHDLPYALQMCERSVIMRSGRIVADGPTPEVLTDEDTMRSNRLELPLGFDPSAFLG